MSTTCHLSDESGKSEKVWNLDKYKSCMLCSYIQSFLPPFAANFFLHFFPVDAGIEMVYEVDIVL